MSGSKPSEPKDGWDIFGIVTAAVGSILVPVAVVAVGFLLSHSLDEKKFLEQQGADKATSINAEDTNAEALIGKLDPKTAPIVMIGWIKLRHPELARLIDNATAATTTQQKTQAVARLNASTQGQKVLQFLASQENPLQNAAAKAVNSQVQALVASMFSTSAPVRKSATQKMISNYRLSDDAAIAILSASEAKLASEPKVRDSKANQSGVYDGVVALEQFDSEVLDRHAKEINKLCAEVRQLDRPRTIAAANALAHEIVQEATL